MNSLARMSAGLSPLAIGLALCAAPLAAHQKPSDTGAETLEAIPAIASKETEDTRTVSLGSRIPKTSRSAGDDVATGTSMNGLTPTGLSYDDVTIRKITRSCKASNTNISKETACVLLSARSAMDDADWLTVRGLLVPLAGDAKAQTSDRRAAADYLLEAAGLADSEPARREALELLLETGTVAPGDAAKVHRNLADMARRAGDMDAARGHLEASLTHDPAAPQTLANLAVLEREAGLPSASATMIRAIAAMEADGGDVPESWRQFAAQS